MDLSQLLEWIKDFFKGKVHPLEGKNLMNKPSTLIDAVNKAGKTGDHSEIYNSFKKENFSLGIAKLQPMTPCFTSLPKSSQILAPYPQAYHTPSFDVAFICTVNKTMMSLFTLPLRLKIT